MHNKIFSKKIPTAVLGATGAVGQRFVQLLEHHPWFEVAAVTGSARTSGGKYGQVCQWVLDGDPPARISEMIVRDSEPDLPVPLVFSALPAKIARDVEPRFAQAGTIVCSNASSYRQEPGVPLIIPEVNADHLAMIEEQRAQKSWPGLIVTSPNCTTSGLALTLKPLDQAFGIRQVLVTTMQAVSGAGYPGVSYMDIAGNIIPFIDGEEEKIEQETRLLLGTMNGNRRLPADMDISAQANRVAVMDGHTLSMALKFERVPTVEDAARVLSEFQSPEQVRSLPSAPERIIYLRNQPSRPQPRRDRNIDRGMAVTVGRMQACSVMDLRLVSVVHNTLRGAASGSILNAELLVIKGYLGDV
ncbi:MAG: aspartate-semialdehyde dehydrogenase [Chloroflexota bacterium]